MSELTNAAKIALTHSCNALALEIPVGHVFTVFVEILGILQVSL